jgi:hypothetical protein
MVATDVASRGIGMIKNPPSPNATLPSAYIVVTLLSTLRRPLDCVFARVLSCLLVLSLRVSWKRACSMSHATLVILTSKYFPGYKIWKWHLLT